MRGFRTLTALSLLAVCPATPGAAQPLPEPDRLAVFDEVAATVERSFFDPGMNGLDWPAAVAEHRARIAPEMDREAFAAEVNALLGRLQASHTTYVTQDSPAWGQLLGVFLEGNEGLAETMAPFLDPDREPVYAGIGAFMEKRAEGWFVTGVLDGFPAQEAGILLGDRLVAAEEAPFHPIRSFRGRAEQPTRLLIERRPGERRELLVTPRLLNGRTMFETAMRRSARIVERRGARIGHVRIWSYAGDKYQKILRYLLGGALQRADVLVLDIRGGWGGASASYLNLFADRSVVVATSRRYGAWRAYPSGWTKPVVLLVDEGSRSGKEIIAHGFRALGIGPIVGERTAGAVLAGRLYPLPDGSFVYVAVADVRVDGVRLEGRGVAPDVPAPFDPAYAAGADPQWLKALDVAAELVR